MQQTKSDRLRIARSLAGFHSASQAARSLGVSTPTYIHHENGTREFGPDAARIYAKRFHVNVSWLLLGEGDAVDEKAKQEAQQEKEEEKKIAASLTKEQLEERENWSKELETKKLLEIMKDVQLVPLISPAFDKKFQMSNSWHRFINLEDTVRHEVISWFGVPKYTLNNHFGSGSSTTILFPIDGDAMSPTFENGDIVVVGTAHQDFTQDGIYLITDGVTIPDIRRVQKLMFSDPPSVRISADNPNISAFDVPIDAVQFIGKVCGRFSVM